MEKAKKLEALYIKRSAIAKQAKNKLPNLESFLDKFQEPLEQCLIYCADTIQMDAVATILSQKGIATQKITAEESATVSKHFNGMSERDFIIDNFARGHLKVLLAMDCLDEGVDIPSARIGIIMASSGNAKEFIQRRGRLMRRAEGKNLAQIYDFCVLPSDTSSPAASKAISKVELSRIREFGAEAINSAEIDAIINQLEGDYIA
jgi:superfamily II DNA or RNA helicase